MSVLLQQEQVVTRELIDQYWKDREADICKERMNSLVRFLRWLILSE